MKALWVAALAAVIAAPRPKRAPAPAPKPPVGELPMLPSIARVHVDVTTNAVVVEQDIALPRGQWRGDALDFYVAYGAPGAPLAFESTLLPVNDGQLTADATERGEPVESSRAAQRPRSAYLLIGRPHMAGSVVHIRADALSRALARSHMASLRLRSLHPAPTIEPDGSRELIVRLGMVSSAPLTLGRLEIAAREGPPIIRAHAELCGEEADAHRLAIHITGHERDRTSRDVIAPVLARRHPSDDLCIRYWTAAGP